MTETPTNTGAVGAEYVLVPREPTEEMVKASCRALYAAHRRDPAHKVQNKSQKHRIRLRAAIAAAPTPPGGKEGGSEPVSDLSSADAGPLRPTPSKDAERLRAKAAQQRATAADRDDWAAVLTEAERADCLADAALYDRAAAAIVALDQTQLYTGLYKIAEEAIYRTAHNGPHDLCHRIAKAGAGLLLPDGAERVHAQAETAPGSEPKTPISPTTTGSEEP